jgi:hypothetical protein
MTTSAALLVEERVHQFGSSVGGEPEEILARRHSGAIVFFKDEREPDVVADQLHRAIDEEPRVGVFPLEIIAVFLQFVITSSSIHIANNLPIDPARSVMITPRAVSACSPNAILAHWIAQVRKWLCANRIERTARLRRASANCVGLTGFEPATA